MDKIEQQITRLQGLDFWQIIKNVIMDNKEVLIDLVTAQLQKGETKTGKTDEYSLYNGESPYAKMKAVMGKYDMSIFPYANLYDEGDFYKQMDVVVQSEFIEIFSNDWKAQKLEKEFGNEIYVPNSQRMGLLIEFILPEVLIRIRKHLGYAA